MATTSRLLALPTLGISARFTGDDGDSYYQRIDDAVAELSPLVDIVRRTCPHTAAIFDIGANIGISAVLLGKALPAATIHAIEPAPSTFASLSVNLADNHVSNVVPHQLAISDRPGNLSFHLSDNSSANHIVSDQHAVAAFANLSGTVPAVTLDDLVAAEGLDRVDFIKLDVEGFEIDALAGMKGTLARHAPVVFMEFNSWTMIAFRNLNPRDLIAAFRAISPVVLRCERDGGFKAIGTDEEWLAFLADNIHRHGCVDDLIGCTDPSKLDGLRTI